MMNNNAEHDRKTQIITVNATVELSMLANVQIKHLIDEGAKYLIDKA